MSQSPFSDHDLLLGVTTRDALPLFSVEERRDGIEVSGGKEVLFFFHDESITAVAEILCRRYNSYLSKLQ